MKNTSLLLVLALFACSSAEESTPVTSATDTGTASADTGTTAAETSGEDTNVVAMDTAPTTSDVKLEIQNAVYKSSTAAGGGFVHAVTYSLVNTSTKAVTSIDTATWDFGGGQKVSLTKPPCSGMFAIAAGAKRTVDVQIVVNTSGSVNNFSIICGSSQHFGGASGTAPPLATFSDPIALTVSGKTDSGTFTATGSASPK
jgi:hypothetical protein